MNSQKIMSIVSIAIALFIIALALFEGQMPLFTSVGGWTIVIINSLTQFAEKR